MTDSRQRKEGKWACWGHKKGGSGCGRCICAVAIVNCSGVVQAWRQLAKLGTLHIQEPPQRVDDSHDLVDWLYEELCLAVLEDGLR